MEEVMSWREERHTLGAGDEQNSAWTMQGAPFPLTESADLFPPHTKDAVSWYHRNESSPAFTETMRLQSLQSAAGTIPDPILHRTFGGPLTGSGFTPTHDRAISTAEPVKTFALRVAAPS